MDGLPQFDRATNNVVVTVDQPQPHQIETNLIVHAFQGLDDPTTGRYVGEFKVTAVDGNRITLTPSYKPNDARQKLVENARGPWTLYEVIPADTNELFAGLTEDQVREVLPPPPQRLPNEANDAFQARHLEHEEWIAEYLQDNKPAKPDDPPAWSKNLAEKKIKLQVIVKFVKDQTDLTEDAKADLRAIDFGENLVKSGIVMKVDLQTAEELVRLGLAQEVERRYQRQLRDYGYILREYYRQLRVVEDHIANLEKDLAYMEAANKIADKHKAEATAEEAALKQELALVTKERSVVTEFHGTLQDRLDKVNAEIARLRSENQRLATQLQRRQLEAVEGPSRSASKEPRAESRESRAGTRSKISRATALNSRL
jgi:hypothetical protein